MKLSTSVNLKKEQFLKTWKTNQQQNLTTSKKLIVNKQ